MRIKSIQNFRTNWRNTQGYDMPNWDENFIGSIHGEKSGFYKMVNGIVHNIKADLTPKLQNAQDEQAIYEFLQNAADSRSSECAVIYDEDFFMVLNNGTTFSEKDLKALLNSFQGTKSDKTKPENCEKIGRYGIGFKLAYRLMGKSDGAEELLRDLAGPIIFSWYNHQQFNDLLEYKNGSIKTADDINAVTEPWLLKIILACFPTFPNEEVKDLDYQSKVLFPQEDLTELVAFLNKHQHILENFSLEQGSLFFLRFGPKKHEKLKESLLNIKSGIGYAMNNLKTLEKVVLQDEIIAQHQTNFERYSILPNTEDFRAIDPEFPNCPIEISLGFPASLEQMKALKAAPSLYQYFPMRNERHNMAYFIHSSSFAKITDRTRLDDQGEANIETFKYIARSLQRNMNRYKKENFEGYVQIYQALLLTDRSTEYDAELINKYLYDPLLNYIKNSIPTNKNNLYLKDLVIAKGTALPIEPMMLGIGKEWFYWTDTELESDLIRAAANRAKLGLTRWGLKELILEANLNLLNNWIVNLREEDYNIFVLELKKINFDKELLERFADIKCFKFIDSRGDSLFYAINDLQDQADIFLMSEKTMPIREAIKGLGFSVLEFNILDYSAILQSLKSQLDYLTDDKALFHKIAARTATAKLNAPQKQQLYQFLKSLDKVSTDDLRSLVLFCNQEGLVAPLKGLLITDITVEYWLEPFRIAKEEENEELAKDCISTANIWEVYTNIIVPFWAELLQGLDTSKEETITEFYQAIQGYYNQKSGQSKLTNCDYIYTDSELKFCSAEQVFYHKSLISFAENYEDLRTAVQKVFGLALPQQQLLTLLGSDPVRTVATTASKTWKKELPTVLENCKTIDLTAVEKIALFQLLKEILPPKDLARLALFSNHQGDKIVLSQLISASNKVEFWLDNYKIAAEEDAPILQNYLAKETTIYSDIIVKEWPNIISNPKITEDIKAFYQGVIKYARLAKSPKSLLQHQAIFINKEVGFVGSSEVFYHQKMLEAEKYTDLQTALHHLTNLHAPQADIIEFLQCPSFKMRDSILSKMLVKTEVVLNKAEAVSFVKFFEQTKENIFTFLCLTLGENNKEYIVNRKGKTVQYAVEKGQESLGDKINEIFGEKYKLLPAKLYVPSFRNKGLLRGTDLFNILSKSKEASPDLLSALIMESGNADLQKKVFSKIDKIVLKYGQTYDNQSFEHQSLQIFRNKEADYNLVRSKIFVEDEKGELHRLTDLAYDSDITISIERFGKYKLLLAEVLPTFKKYQKLLQNIANQLVDYEAPTLLKRRCFGGEEKPIKEIFDILQKEQKVLDNSQQLAFVLLYAKWNNDSKAIRNFELHNRAEKTVTIAAFDAFHIHENSFIDKAAILSEHYKGVDKLLKMSQKYTAFTFGRQQLVYEPYIEKNTFYCLPMRTLQEGEDASILQTNLLNFLYKKWAAIEDLNRPMQLDLQTDKERSLSTLLPRQLVYPAAYALPKEQLADWLLDWLEGEKNEIVEELITEEIIRAAVEEGTEAEEEQTEKPPTIVRSSHWIPKGKLSLLKAIGVNTPSSGLVQLRSYFETNEGETSQKQLNYLWNKEAVLLEQTIFWLEKKAVVLSSEDERLYWLRKLYNTLPTVSQDWPLPYITAVLGEEEQPVYQYKVASLGDKSYYYFDQKHQSQLIEKFQISMAAVHQILEETGDRLSNLEIKGIGLKTSKIDNALDIAKIKENSQEWGADYYLKWRSTADYSIYLYEGEIPYQVHFLDRVIYEYTKGNAVLHDKTAFVNRFSSNIEEDLFAITKYNALKEADLLLLLRYKNEGNEQPSSHKVIERIVETVVIEEQLADNEKAIENPSINAIKEYQETKTKGELKVAFDINELPLEVLEQLMQYAKKSKIIVETEA